MRFIVVYNRIPQAIKVYDVKTEDPKLIERIRACHGKYSNLDNAQEDNDNLDFLYEFLENQPTVYDDDSVGNGEDVPRIILDAPQTEVIITGIVL